MHYATLDKSHQKTITNLFTSTFSTSANIEEGKLIGELVNHLFTAVDNQDIVCFGAYEKASLVGAIFFTRLQFATSSIQVYMLAPVAVGTAHQGKGVGQALITHGLHAMKQRAVSVVITYGDPAFYSKVGFKPLPETTIQAPLPLSIPAGWLGQSLTQSPIPSIKEKPACVTAFNKPVYW